MIPVHAKKLPHVSQLQANVGHAAPSFLDKKLCAALRTRIVLGSFDSLRTIPSENSLSKPRPFKELCMRTMGREVLLSRVFKKLRYLEYAMQIVQLPAL
jgi:hypothetical protein